MMPEGCMYRAETIDWDDGFRPGGATAMPTKMVVQSGKQSAGFLSIFDNLMPDPWCDRAYEYAVDIKRPWGAYVTTRDVMDEALSAENIWAEAERLEGGGETHSAILPQAHDLKERALALVAARSLVFGRGRAFVDKDIPYIHGTAVWCLASGVTNEVEYHIDYAELFRYETGVIQPPMYCGTVHVSPLGPGDMDGGDFAVHSGGLDHYKKHGYKGLLSSRDAVPQELEACLQGRGGEWMLIKYKPNRGIMHDGDFPHLSTKVTSIEPGKKRVILGLNCFPSSVGECCIRAPEHSLAFNRTVKLYQAMSTLAGGAKVESKYGNSNTNNTDNSSSLSSSTTEGADCSSAAVVTAPAPIAAAQSKFSAKDIAKNPALARLLVAAARRAREVQRREGVEQRPGRQVAADLQEV